MSGRFLLRNHIDKQLLQLWSFAFILISFSLTHSASAQSSSIPQLFKQDMTIKAVPIIEGLRITWGMDLIDNQRLLFTQRSGKLGLLNMSDQSIVWILGVPKVYANRQGGLLDIKVAEDFSKSGYIYLTYSKPVGSRAVTVLARAELKGNQLQEWQDLLITKSQSPSSIHFGSRIAFDGKGHVFFSVGDRGQRFEAQNLKNHQGTIIRLNLDGSVPKDNPFVDRFEALPEIWSYGHRNPQGLFFDKTTGKLWEIEHGPRGGDEINLIEKGQNYGWPVVSQGKEYSREQAVGVKHKAGMKEPVYVYIPSIAPSDLLLYRKSDLTNLENSLITGAMKLRHLNVVTIENEVPTIEHRYLHSLNQRIRALAQAPDGRLFIATDNGLIYQLE